MKITSFLLIFFSLLIIPTVTALGVTGRYTIEYQPDVTVPLELCVLPSGSPIVQFEVEGVLKDYVKIDPGPHNLSGYTCIPYTIYLPPTIDQQGLVETIIRVSEVPADESQQMLSFRVSMIHQIWVIVPYKGKYLDISLNAPPVRQGEKATFTIDITNKGNQTINTASGTLTIRSTSGKITTLKTDSANIVAPKEKRTLSAQWNTTSSDPGLYTIEANVTYDEFTRGTKRDFKIGDLNVVMRDHASELVKGGIREFLVVAESIWPDEIENVQAIVNISAPGSQAFTTLPQTIPPWGTVNLIGYANTNEIPLGTWPATITLKFSGKENTYETNVTIIEPPTIRQPANVSTGMPSWMIILAASITGLLAAVIILLVIVIKQRKRG